jgi:hypothetical protein
MIGDDGWDSATKEAATAAVGHRISSIELRGDKLRIGLDDGRTLELYDGAQGCCEHRFMTTDDELDYFIGAGLLDIDLRPGASESSTVDDFEDTEFLDIRTSRGVFTMVNHNHHNGYYGGFDITARLL